jgi:hypothetical protein
MILRRILSSIAYNIHFDFGLQNSVFFTVKTPIIFLFFFPAPCSLLIFLYDYATTSPEFRKKGIDPGDFLGFPFRGFEGKGITHSHLPTE